MNRENQGPLPKRQAHLEQLRRVLVPSPPWEEWLAETGELPPDFDAMPSCPDLPDPLLMTEDGSSTMVGTAAQWEKQREQLKRLLKRWALGEVPPAPESIRVEVLKESYRLGAWSREVTLHFGPEEKASLWLELLIPDGDGPFPVFMTQHNHRNWGLIALRRGYLVCVYAGADSRDDSDSFILAYPEYDWSRLTRRAWAASRCLDYLEQVPEAGTARVALTGHSRNGKQSLIASALDERFALVISSSSGEGGALTTRYFSSQHFGEGIELGTLQFPDWFHPRLRFFIGREDKLPVDFHALVALSAPRPCLLSTALNDGCETTWAIQQTYLSAKRAYDLLEAGDNLQIMWRPGGHETQPTVIEAYLDWCDGYFGREGRRFSTRFVYPHDWEGWREASGETATDVLSGAPGDLLVLNSGVPVASVADWQKRKEEIRQRLGWVLGTPPPQAAHSSSKYGLEAPHVASLLRRERPSAGVEKIQVMFGEYINADVYTPAGLHNSGAKAPAVLWLHPLSFAHGYAAAYKYGPQVFDYLAQNGFAVFCFDQIGFGRRIEEAEYFYQRHPRWSLLGKMVRDCQRALDVMLALPYVDSSRTTVLGYGMGAMIALHFMALDERPGTLISVCGPQPFRLDVEGSETGGVARWGRLHMLLPKLGLFAGKETDVPYDVEHLLACIAPRPALVVTPQLDREAKSEDVAKSVEVSRAVYDLFGAGHRLVQSVPEDYNHLGPAMQTLVLDWLRDETS